MKYVGPLDAVIVPLPNGTEVVVENGHQVEIEDAAFAKALLEQKENWQAVSSSSSSSDSDNRKEQS